ncbi:MAG TPA: response regulator [Burkholderiales bacterium]
MGLRIIIADDDRDTVWTLGAILRDEGHAVQGVHRGEDVLRVARYLRPDAAVIDLAMPGMSGYAVAQELRTLFYPAPGPLLIAISGTWLRGSDRLLAQHIGFDHHLAKPCDPQELLAILDPRCGARRIVRR